MATRIKARLLDMPSSSPLKLMFLRAVLVLCGIAALGALVLMGWGMIRGSSLKVSSTVIATVVSPNGQVQAIVTRTDGGPSVEYGYLIDLKSVTPNAWPIRVANLYGAQKTRTEPGMALVWRNDNTLEIHYYLARIAHVEQPDETIGGQHVTTVLKPVVPEAAPPI